jgi:hypothetical protein
MSKAKAASPSFMQHRLARKPLIDTEPPLEQARPAGPFRVAAPGHTGDLLIFVPRNRISRSIDLLSGRYGYSHLAIDCGEVDTATGRRVMIEAVMGAGVTYAFQEEYGPRPFVRILLRQADVDVEQFCQCVHRMVGEKFDDVEAISLGILDNPARQICSDLATNCLPESMRQLIERYHRRAVIHPLAAVRDERAGSRVRLFMSPNGFAEFLGAPRGSQLQGPDVEITPRLGENLQEGPLARLGKRASAVLTRLLSSVDSRRGYRSERR